MADSKAPRLVAAGVNIPAIGLGTSRLRGDTCVRSILDAIDLGYRHIDTADMYGNEADVGEAIKRSRVPRSELFVTTKVLPDNLARGALQDAARRSLGRLGFDYVDLSGLARHIGVANFTVAMLEQAVSLAAGHGETIATNQVEYHPRLNQDRVLAACSARGVVLVSYCPVGQGNCLDDPTVVAIAKDVSRTPAQVVLRWHVQQDGVAAIPKSSSRAHLAENLSVFDFELSPDQMAALSRMAVPNGRIINPSFGPAWD
jgi:diketogulonate reductase-like aldo/keto reductase